MILPIMLAAVVGLIAFWRLPYGLAALIILWPSYLWRATIAGVPTTGLELSIYAVTIAGLIDFFRRRPGFDWLRLAKIWFFFLGLLTLAWVVATVFATNHQAALGAFKAWWFDALLFASLLLYTIRTAEQRQLILKAALVSGLLVALAGLVQLAAFRSTLQDGRLSSFFHPVANYAAMYLCPLFILGLGLVLWRVLRGWLWWTIVGVIGLAAVMTVSFAGYVAVAVAAALIWWWLPAGRLKQRLGWTAAIVIVMAGVVLPQTRYFHEHFNSTDRSSALVRSQIWVTSWALIQQHPITGIGPNTFEPNYRAEIPKHYWPPLEWLVAQPHNLYLALWLETGLLGLLTFLGFVAYWMRRTWTKAHRSEMVERGILLSCLAAMLSVLVHGFFDTPYFKNDLALEFSLLVMLPWIGQVTSKLIPSTQTKHPVD